MFFENAVEGYEYSGRGTCFLCRYREHDFIVTAKHVIRDFLPDSVRVLFHDAAREFVPYNARATIKPNEADSSDDTDWSDIAIFPLQRSLYKDEQFLDQRPYVIPFREYVWRSELAGRFIMRGFPHDRSYVDYDDAVLREQAVILEADLVGAAPMKNCFEIRFRDLSHCTDLNGMSGTPVFWVGDKEPRAHCFAGLAIRASYSSGIGYFVHADVVMAAFAKILC